MRMVRVEKDWQSGLLAYAFHQSSKLARTKKLPLSFGSADEYRKFGLSRGGDHRLQQDVVSNIEMAEGCAFFFQPCQNIAQCIFVGVPESSNCRHCDSLCLR